MGVFTFFKTYQIAQSITYVFKSLKLFRFHKNKCPENYEKFTDFLECKFFELKHSFAWKNLQINIPRLHERQILMERWPSG